MSKSSCNFSDVSPTYTPVKSNRIFFFRIIFDPDCKISIECSWRWCLSKYSLTKLKNAIYVICKHDCQQGLGDESMHTARCQFCDIKFSHRITGAMSSLDYIIHDSILIIFHWAHKWSKCVVSEFYEIMWHKWYFCKVLMIKSKRDNGISIADTVEILIPLACSETSLCKHYYQASHPYNEVEKKYRSYDRPLLNTVGMGQDSRISNCWCSEDILALSHRYISGNMHHYHAIHSHCASSDIVFKSIYPWLRARQ